MNNKYKKILIIRLGAIGDVVNCCIINQSIKAKYPDAKIHFLTTTTIAPLLESDPSLDKVWGFDFQKKNSVLQVIKLVFQLFCQRFDLVINLQNSLRNIIFSVFSIPKKIVSKDKYFQGHASEVFFQSVKKAMPEVSAVDKVKLFVSEENIEYARAKIVDLPKPIVVINAGGESDNSRQGRIWPLSKWVQLGNILNEKYGASIVAIGSKAERGYQNPLLDINGVSLFAGELSLAQSTALISLANVFISGDSGPLHIASALGVNTVGLFGSTSISACGIYGENATIISAPQNYAGCIACNQKTCSVLESQSSQQMYTPCMDSIEIAQLLKCIDEKKLLNME